MVTELAMDGRATAEDHKDTPAISMVARLTTRGAEKMRPLQNAPTFCRPAARARRLPGEPPEGGCGASGWPAPGAGAYTGTNRYTSRASSIRSLPPALRTRLLL